MLHYTWIIKEASKWYRSLVYLQLKADKLEHSIRWLACYIIQLMNKLLVAVGPLPSIKTTMSNIYTEGTALHT